jgi:hypothetical protein
MPSPTDRFLFRTTVDASHFAAPDAFAAYVLQGIAISPTDMDTDGKRRNLWVTTKRPRTACAGILTSAFILSRNRASSQSYAHAAISNCFNTTGEIDSTPC